MREIKFKYGYSDSINTFEKAFTLEEIEQGLQFEEISDSPLLKNYKIVYKRQYTGLKDKNGVEIYENDIVSFDNNGFNDRGVVIYDAPCFVVEGFFLIDNSLEVIGNIYKNPDLLKG